MKTISVCLFFILPVFPAFAAQVTAPMQNARALHESVAIDSNRILVAGGSHYSFGNLSSSEIFNVFTNTWKTANMSAVRDEFTLTKIDDGKIMAIGGCTDAGLTHAYTEIFDPMTETWSNAGNLALPRAAAHTATKLNNGKILIAGGYVDSPSSSIKELSAKVEIYDPVTQTSVFAADMSVPQARHTATLLNDGRVLVLGTGTGEIYDPATNTWTATGQLIAPRSGHTANLLPDGRVFVTGGGNSSELNSAEIFNPATGVSQAVASMTVKRTNHRAIELFGKIYVIGGARAMTQSEGFGFVYHSSMEIFDPVTKTWVQGMAMSQPRAGLSVARLGNTIFASGGNASQSLVLNSMEMIGTIPSTFPTPTPAPTPVPTPTPAPSASWTSPVVQPAMTLVDFTTKCSSVTVTQEGNSSGAKIDFAGTHTYRPSLQANITHNGVAAVVFPKSSFPSGSGSFTATGKVLTGLSGSATGVWTFCILDTDGYGDTGLLQSWRVYGGTVTPTPTPVPTSAPTPVPTPVPTPTPTPLPLPVWSLEGQPAMPIVDLTNKCTSLTVTKEGAASGVYLGFNATHTWRSALSATLSHNGQTFPVFNAGYFPGGGGGASRAYAPVAGFTGSALGVWEFCIKDNDGYGDSGTLNAWGVRGY
ncbi:MAG: kelch repeat-containing protein [Bdellovibrionia bacterium]